VQKPIIDLYKLQQLGLENLFSKVQVRAENISICHVNELTRLQTEVESMSKLIHLQDFFRNNMLLPWLKSRCLVDLAMLKPFYIEMNSDLEKLIFHIETMTAQSSPVESIKLYAKLVDFQSRYRMLMEMESLVLIPFIEKYLSVDEQQKLYLYVIRVFTPDQLVFLLRHILPSVDESLRQYLLAGLKDHTSASLFSQIMANLKADLPAETLSKLQLIDGV
jgi:hypothetical protein